MDEYTQYIDKINLSIDNVLKKFDSLLTTPCRAIINNGGKRFRPLLTVLYYMALGGDAPDYLYDLAAAVELIHTASLIHDDIEDNSTQRRGKPCVHITYGVDTAINCASWLYFAAGNIIENAPKDKRATLYSAYIKTLLELHKGQALDIYYHNSSEFPAIENYHELAQCKTGSLIAFAFAIACILCNESDNNISLVIKTAKQLGEGFQILDDAINLKSGNKGKMAGDDIIEGKKSYPILLHIKEHPNDKNKILEYFKEVRRCIVDTSAIELGTRGQEECKKFIQPTIDDCIKLLNSTGSVDNAYNIGRDMINNSVESLTDSYKNCDAARLICKMFRDMIQ